MFWTYWIISAVVLFLATREMFGTNDWRKQLAASVALIPLFMRVFLLK